MLRAQRHGVGPVVGGVGRCRDALYRARRARGRTPRIHAAGQLAALASIAAMSFAEPPLYHGKLLPILFLVLAYAELPTSDGE